MAPQEITTEGNTGITPVACTLASADRATQAGGWEQLAARAMTQRVETARGLRISFHPEPGVGEELCKLVAVENQCCPWADWTVEANAEQVVLDVRSAGEGIATLHSMFTSLQPAPPGRRVSVRPLVYLAGHGLED